MKMIRSCLLFFSFFSLSFSLKAKLPTTAHFCLVNEAGSVPESCTGPFFTEENLSYYKDLYTDNFSERTLPTITKRVFHPLMVQSTSQSTNQILKSDALDKLKLQVNTHEINLIRLPQWTIFGGSVAEGQILLPDRGQIHIARKYGRMILATLFLSPDAYGGAALQSQIEYLLNPDKNEPVIANLLNLAKLYGFDGYFINPESSYAAEHKAAFGAFMTKLTEYATKEDYPLHLEWYVVGGEDFPDTVITPDGKKVSGGTFIDHFAWGGASQAWSAYTAEEKETYHPFEFKFGAYGPADVADILTQYAKENSVAYFQFNSVLNPGQFFKKGSHELITQEKKQLLLKDPESQDNNSRTFWVQNKDSFTPYPLNYKLPFYTNFSTGKGLDLFRQGTPLGFGAWNSIALLNPLPDLGTLPLEGSFDYKTVYEGGNSLRFDLEARDQEICCQRFSCRRKKLETNSIELYRDLNFSVENTPLEAHLSYLLPEKTKELTEDSPAKLCLSENEACCFTLSSPSNSWQKATLPINDGGTCELKILDTITFTYTETEEQSSLYLGEFFLKEKKTDWARLILLPDQSLEIQDSKKEDNPSGGSILSWTPTPEALFYDLYLRGVFMGATPHCSFWFEEEDLSKEDVKVIPVYPGTHPSLEDVILPIKGTVPFMGV